MVRRLVLWLSAHMTCVRFVVRFLAAVKQKTLKTEVLLSAKSSAYKVRGRQVRIFGLAYHCKLVFLWASTPINSVVAGRTSTNESSNITYTRTHTNMALVTDQAIQFDKPCSSRYETVKCQFEKNKPCSITHHTQNLDGWPYKCCHVAVVATRI